MKSNLFMSRFGWSVLILSGFLSGCLEDSKSTGSAPAPTTSNPPPQIGSPSEPIDSNPHQDEGLLKVLAAQPSGTSKIVTMKTKDSESNNHCNDGKGQDGDKSKNCEGEDSRGPDSNNGDPGSGGQDNNPDQKETGTITAINLVIQEVSAHSDILDWVVINSTKQTLDLLSLSENAAAVLAEKPLPPGNYDSIRVKLDSGSTIVVDGKSHLLDTPSALKSGIKLNGAFTIEKGYVTSISLNFDPDKSIHKTGNGKYKLKPVIKIAGLQEDITSPSISITNPNFRYTKISQQLVRLEYSDEFLDLNTLSILINGVESKPLFTATEESAELTKVWADGTYKIQPSISDLNKNFGHAEPAEFIVDTQAPQLTFQNQNHYFNTKTPSLKIQATDSLAGIDESSFKVLINNFDVSSAFSISNGELSGSPALNEGVQQIQAGIRDRAGNETQITGLFVVDVTPPSLTQILPAPNTVHYTNTLPITLDFSFLSNERLLEASLNSGTLSLTGDLLNANGPIVLTTPGTLSNTVIAKDLAGNIGSLTTSITLIQDTIAPTIALGLQDQTKTAQNSISLPVTITDSSPTFTEIKYNGELLFITGSKQFEAAVHLNLEGNNLIEVVSKDAAGNVSTTSSLTVIRDTMGPLLTNIQPQNNATIRTVSLIVSGQSDEILSSVTVNGYQAILSENKKLFSFDIVSQNQGILDIQIIASDTLGNQTYHNLSVNIQSKVLVPELITIVPNSNATALVITGATGASRPGAKITAETGFFSFNNGETVSKPDGSFQIELEPFSIVKVTAKDLESAEQESATFNYGSQTKITGVVKSVDNVPLVGATIGIKGSNRIVKSDGTGGFSLDNIPSGDQTLYVDGSTIVVQSGDRKYSKTNIAVNIGLGQSNILGNPIYLAPVMLDGSETTVTAGSGAIVTSEHAPGVELQIPSNATLFPDGTPAGKISMSIIPSDRATVPVPGAAVPNTVITLEPSGTTFNQRVQLTLPNDNELPPGVEMAILSMNSNTGEWEIDGLATVSSDGNSVVTKPGRGISHFSLVYAVPVKPVIEEISDQKISGIDASQGSLSTKIELPSFKSKGNEVTPSLIYKSSWAAPSVFISNWFDIPSQRITATTEFSSERSKIARVSTEYCDVLRLWCTTNYQTYLLEMKRRNTISSTSWYQPDSIRSQFFVGTIASDEAVFTGQDSQTVYDQPPNFIPGSAIKLSRSSEVFEYQGIPNQSVLSYGVDLRLPVTGEYLPSGVYPTLARYQIRLKNLTLTTTQNAAVLKVNGGFADVEYSQKSYLKQTKGQNILAPDLVSSVIVQNKVNSAAGRGWQVTGSSKILNPNSSRIVVEEPDGSISTYGLNNPISTVFNAGSTNVDLSSSVDFTSWPQVTMVSFTANNVASLVTKDLSVNNSAITSVSNVPQSSGTLGNQGYTACPADYSGTFAAQAYPYTAKAQVNGLFKAPDGSYVITNAREHSVWRLRTNNSVRLAGIYDDIDLALEGPFNFTPNMMANFCNSNFGIPCGTPQSIGSYSCSAVKPQICPPNVSSCKPWRPPTFILSNGTIGIANFSGDNQSGLISTNPRQIGFNNPGRAILSPDGRIVVADTGNNRIRALNLQTNTITTIAGNGSNVDTGENIPAVNAGIYHPIAVTYDNQGNLYFTTELGYIKKIDATGFITTVAGLPLQLGGQLSDEAPAKQMYFNRPLGLVIDNVNKQLFVADTNNNRVVRIDLLTQIASVIAGNGQCVEGNIGDLGPAITSSLCNPTQVSLDEDQNLIIVDSGHKRIRKVNFSYDQSATLAFSPTRKDLSTLVKNADGTWVRTLRNGSRLEYSAAGHLTKIQSRGGGFQSYEYDSSGNLITVTDSVGQQTKYTYGSNKLLSIQDPAGRTTSFEHDGKLLSRVVYPDGTNKRFEYDENGLLIKEINERNLATEYQYNNYKRIHKIKHPDGSAITINDAETASAVNNFTSGNTGILSSSGTGEGQVKTSIIDQKNQVTEYSKDINGYVSTIKNAIGEITTIERDLYGNPTKIKSDDGVEVVNVYDSTTFDLVSTKNINTGIEESFTYDTYGNLISTKDGKGQITTRTFASDKNLLLTETTPGGITKTYSYYQNGQLSSQTTYPSSGNTITVNYEYDSKGNLTKITDAAGKQQIFSHDLAGNVISISTPGGAESNLKHFVYDSFNRYISVTDAKGSKTEYMYFPTGQLAQIKAPNSKTTVFEYDLLGRINKKIEPNGAEFKFTYDLNGNIQTEIDPNGNTKTYTYDGVNRLKQVQLPDDLIQYDYDSRGHITQASNKNSIVTLNRDPFGRIVHTRTDGIGALAAYPAVDILYTYNDIGQRTSLQSTALSYIYNYDSASRLGSMSNSNGSAFNFFYDNSNRLIQINRPGSRSNYSYNPGQTIASIIHSSSGVTKSFAEYTYDFRNLPLTRKNTLGTTTYDYDQTSQLTSATTSSSANEMFSYDSLGNRTSDENGSYEYDQYQDKLTEDWQYKYTYDKNGNLLLKTSKVPNQLSFQHSYDSRNQLVETKIFTNILNTPQKQIFYSYDALGRRIEKRVTDFTNGFPTTKARRYIYDDQNILAEYNQANELLVGYTHSPLAPDDILAMSVTNKGATEGIANNQGEYYFLKDNLGSVTDIISTGGNITQRYEYSSFGKLISIKDGSNTVVSNPVINQPFTFTGREFDSETGLYYLRARYYDPQNGRFLQKDPSPGSLMSPITFTSSYIYANNSPTFLRDPNGRWAWFVPIIIGAVVSGIMNSAIRGWSWDNFIIGAINGAVGTTAVMTGAWAGYGLGMFLSGAGGATLGAALGGAFGGAVFGGITGGPLGAIVGGAFGFMGGAFYGAARSGLPVPGWTDIPIEPPTEALPPPNTSVPPPPTPVVTPTIVVPDARGIPVFPTQPPQGPILLPNY